MSAGRIDVAIEAGYLWPTNTPPSPRLGQQLKMDGSSAFIYITPEVAKQWLAVLETIAGEK